jgi:hypothetical protein
MEERVSSAREDEPTVADRCRALFGTEIVASTVNHWLDQAVASGVPLAGERFESRHEYVVRTNEALGELRGRGVFRFGEFRDAWYDASSSRIMVPAAAFAGDPQNFLAPYLPTFLPGGGYIMELKDTPYTDAEYEFLATRQMYPVGDDYLLASPNSIFGYRGEDPTDRGQISHVSQVRRDRTEGYDTPWVFVVDMTRAELLDEVDEISFAFIGRPSFPYVVKLDTPNEQARAAVFSISCIALVAGDRVLATAPVN